jgi:hypothetical protein
LCWSRASSATLFPSGNISRRQQQAAIHPDDPHIVAVASDVPLCKKFRSSISTTSGDSRSLAQIRRAGRNHDGQLGH